MQARLVLRILGAAGIILAVVFAVPAQIDSIKAGYAKNDLGSWGGVSYVQWESWAQFYWTVAVIALVLGSVLLAAGYLIAEDASTTQLTSAPPPDELRSKTCPICGTSVMIEAVRCKNCRHEFAPVDAR